MADQAHNKTGERYYVMPTDDAKLIVIDRANFRIMKQKHYISSRVSVRDLVDECFYHTPYRDGKGELPPDVMELKRRQYYAWAGVCRLQKKSSKRSPAGRQGRRQASTRPSGQHPGAPAAE